MMYYQRYHTYQWLSSTVLLIALIAFAFVATNLARHQWLSIHSIHVSGGSSGMRNSAIRLLRGMAQDNVLNWNLQDWQQPLEALPSIARVHVRRHLPSGSLLVSLEAHQPLARWEDGGLIDIYGEHYEGVVDAVLPIFKGPAGQVRRMVELYDDAIKILQVPAITQLELSARGDWQLFLQDGVVLYLGQKEARRRLYFYRRHAAALRQRFVHLGAVDLRYEHGMAVTQRGEG